ncbi:EAL domain-containing protein [Sphaerotilus sp.]|uniref:EAL domain-containing protein n=1 Tax=Sphaerotilus sp. TaxID=2093942 RepID=UPI0034E1C572
MCSTPARAHPTQGETAPLSFIPLAEETGLIVPIGAWVLRQACADAVRWPQPLRVSVNLSLVQLRSRHLIDEVRQVLAMTELPAGRLEFGLTATLQDMRALGVGLALDDFGPGFSSLAYLQRFRFDHLKIDRSFVQFLVDLLAQTPETSRPAMPTAPRSPAPAAAPR